MMRRLGLTLGLVLMGCGTASQADAPPEIRSGLWTKCSLDGRACATVDRLRSRTTIRSGSAAAWSVTGAPQSLSISNDGKTLVEQYRGADLLEADAGPSTIMLIFIAPGHVVRTVTLHDLIANIPGLPRSVSHRIWASAFGFDTDGSYVVDTVEGRRFRYNFPGATMTITESPTRR